ncbi:hypothetical protein JCM15579A_02240 [Marinifilum fragile]
MCVLGNFLKVLIAGVFLTTIWCAFFNQKIKIFKLHRAFTHGKGVSSHEIHTSKLEFDISF